MPDFEIHTRETFNCTYPVKAASADEARKMFDEGRVVETSLSESIDHDIIKIEEVS